MKFVVPITLSIVVFGSGLLLIKTVGTSSLHIGEWFTAPQQVDEGPVLENEESTADSPSSSSQSASPSAADSSIIDPTSPPLNPTSSNNDGGLRDDWMYPNASIVTSTENQLILSSTDDSDAITQWYRSRLDAASTGSTSNVTTSVNGQVKNVLAASTKEGQITVEIRQAAESSNVEIDISIN